MGIQTRSALKNTNRTFDNILDSFINKDDLNFQDNPHMALNSAKGLPECLMLGLNPTWIQNFGGATLAAGTHTTDVHMLDVLTPTNTLFKMSLALARFAKQGSAVTAAQAEQIFGITSNAGALLSMTGVATGTTAFIPTAKMVRTISGTTTANVALTGQGDLASDQDMGLILFNDYVIENGHNLDVETNAANEHKASACEVICSGNNDNIFTRQTATSDGDQNIILTATGDTTILAGSYIYLNPGADTDELTIKGCIRTSGGTVAVTFAAL